MFKSASAIGTTLIATLGLLASMGATSPREESPTQCSNASTLSVRDLPEVTQFKNCDIRGRVVRSQYGASVKVPTDETSVTANILMKTGGVKLEVRVDKLKAQITETFTPATHTTSAPLDPCVDAASNLGPAHWPRGSTVNWSYFPGTANDSGLPGGESGWGLSSLSNAMYNATFAYTDCVPYPYYQPKANIYAAWQGWTNTRPNINGEATCESGNNLNSIGWMGMPWAPSGLLAVTCRWWDDSTIKEADIAMQTYNTLWWTGDPDIDPCEPGRFSAIAVATHEVLHWFGLDHVAGDDHSNLSMSPYVSPCDSRASTLGSGDYDGLIKLYGGR